MTKHSTRGSNQKKIRKMQARIQILEKGVMDVVGLVGKQTELIMVIREIGEAPGIQVVPSMSTEDLTGYQ
ncbi:MAG: hypothetical protein WC455_21875 [Dehalococcoidia bacterium]|jgi:hypothetical protein